MKRVPSAKADSILPTLLSRRLRAGLSRFRRWAAGAWFISVTVTITGFRDSLLTPWLHSDRFAASWRASNELILRSRLDLVTGGFTGLWRAVNRARGAL